MGPAQRTHGQEQCWETSSAAASSLTRAGIEGPKAHVGSGAEGVVEGTQVAEMGPEALGLAGEP